MSEHRPSPDEHPEHGAHPEHIDPERADPGRSPEGDGGQPGFSRILHKGTRTRWSLVVAVAGVLVLVTIVLGLSGLLELDVTPEEAAPVQRVPDDLDSMPVDMLLESADELLDESRTDQDRLDIGGLAIELQEAATLNSTITDDRVRGLLDAAADDLRSGRPRDARERIVSARRLAPQSG